MIFKSEITRSFVRKQFCVIIYERYSKIVKKTKLISNIWTRGLQLTITIWMFFKQFFAFSIFKKKNKSYVQVILFKTSFWLRNVDLLQERSYCGGNKGRCPGGKKNVGSI